MFKKKITATTPTKKTQTDPTFLVIGSGIAGLNFALKASKFGNVLILTKNKIPTSNSYKAQGGIAAVISNKDSYKKHIQDTLSCGSFHNKKSAVEHLVKSGPSSIQDLINYGVHFQTNKNGLLVLTREGGHNLNRVAYAGDFTGKAIISTLLNQIKKNPNISIIENAFAINIIEFNKKCIGIKAIIENKIKPIFAPNTIIAAGGLGQIYQNTTNSKSATGDGIAMAHRAGLKCKDMEFIQFHPTALNKKSKFLLSEALRGEGAQLINEQNERYMLKHHPKAEMAPRDIVAKYTYLESLKNKVYLKFINIPSQKIKTRFPVIYKKLKSIGLDLAKDKIPITPAAHYLCGGIKSNIKGQTSINNLFVLGESAHTGIHGANRLASNSLLEAMVCSNELAKWFSARKLISVKNKFEKIKKFKEISTIKTIKADKTTPSETKTIHSIKKSLKNTMWQKVGIVRSQKELKKALQMVTELAKKMERIKNKLNRNYQETLNMITVAKLIIKAAIKRKKSLGTHIINQNK